MRGPVQFNHEPLVTTRAPQASEHTEIVLMEIGMDWDRIEELKERGSHRVKPGHRMTSPSSAWVCTRSVASRASPRWRWASTPSSLAVADAGIEWKDIQFATGGSWTVANPDAIVGMVGLTGIPFTNVFNACATAASAAKTCADGIRLGDYDIGIAIGLDKHPRGAFTEDPALVGMPSWYAENGQYLTTQFFGMKANRYLHDHGISTETLAKVAAKNFRNGALNPNAFRRKPMSEERHPQLADAELSADPVHVLRARRGRRRGGDVPGRHRAPLHRQARVPARGGGPHPPLRRLRGEHHLRAGRRGCRRQPFTPPEPRSKRPAWHPTTST